MGNMEQLEKIDFHKFDPNGMIKHVENFPSLCKEAFDLAQDFSIPSYYIKARKIVFIGMGGSGQAGDILKDLLADTDLIVESVHNYSIPNWVDQDTLVIANSYSGNTEETLSGFIQAYQKGAKLLAITTGGKLKILAAKYKAPIFAFSYDSPPRAAFPYLFMPLISILNKLGYIEFSNDDIGETLSILNSAVTKFGSETSSFQNPAKILAQKIHGKIPVIYASERLKGVSARIKAAFNENGKNFAFSEDLPDLNHKSLEGLTNPSEMVYVLMVESNTEFERNLLRENITADILAKFKVPLERIKFIQAKDRVTEICLHVMFGDFVSSYLAILNKANPGINEIVDLFKNRLT
jgi:glucose/mannose-6-phosphate isomerase